MTAVANEDEGNLRWSHPENAPAWAARQPHVLEELSDDASWVASFLHNLTLARAGLLGEEDRPNFELAKLKFQEVSQRLHLDEDAFTLAVALADGARRIHPETRHFSIINDEILRLSEELITAFKAGSEAAVQLPTRQAEPLNLPFSLSGFTAGYGSIQ